MILQQNSYVFQEQFYALDKGSKISVYFIYHSIPNYECKQGLNTVKLDGVGPVDNRPSFD